MEENESVEWVGRWSYWEGEQDDPDWESKIQANVGGGWGGEHVGVRVEPAWALGARNYTEQNRGPRLGQVLPLIINISVPGGLWGQLCWDDELSWAFLLAFPLHFPAMQLDCHGWCLDWRWLSWGFSVPFQVRDDNKRQHPCLVEFSKLPEQERNYNLQMSLETLKWVTYLFLFSDLPVLRQTRYQYRLIQFELS